MKKIDAYTAILEAVKTTKVDAEALDLFTKDVQKMADRDSAAKAESAEKAAARAEVLTDVIAILKDKGEPMYCKDIVAELGGDFTPQKLSYILKEGVANGKLTRVETGRTVAYSV